MNQNPNLNPALFFKEVASADHRLSVREIVASQNDEFERKTSQLRALRLAMGAQSPSPKKRSR